MKSKCHIGRKREKRRNSLLQPISPFLTMFFFFTARCKVPIFRQVNSKIFIIRNTVCRWPNFDIPWQRTITSRHFLCFELSSVRFLHDIFTINVTQGMVLYFDMGTVISTPLFCFEKKKDADYCKHVILTVIRHLPITREATIASFRVCKRVRFIRNL